VAVFRYSTAVLRGSFGDLQLYDCWYAGRDSKSHTASKQPRESDVRVPMGIVQRTKSLDCFKSDKTALLCAPNISLYYVDIELRTREGVFIP
jgi:hypothetical protein